MVSMQRSVSIFKSSLFTFQFSLVFLASGHMDLDIYVFFLNISDSSTFNSIFFPISLSLSVPLQFFKFILIFFIISFPDQQFLAPSLNAQVFNLIHCSLSSTVVLFLSPHSLFLCLYLIYSNFRHLFFCFSPFFVGPYLFSVSRPSFTSPLQFTEYF